MGTPFLVPEMVISRLATWWAARVERRRVVSFILSVCVCVSVMVRGQLLGAGMI